MQVSQPDLTRKPAKLAVSLFSRLIGIYPFSRARASFWFKNGLYLCFQKATKTDEQDSPGLFDFDSYHQALGILHKTPVDEA